MSKTETSGYNTTEEWSTPLIEKTLPSRQNGKEEENASRGGSLITYKLK